MDPVVNRCVVSWQRIRFVIQPIRDDATIVPPTRTTVKQPSIQAGRVFILGASAIAPRAASRDDDESRDDMSFQRVQIE